MRNLITRLFLSSCMLAVPAMPAWGSIITLGASLDGYQARPPNLVPAFGQATASIDTVSGAFAISGTSRTASPIAGAALRGPNNPPADLLGPTILQLSWSPIPSEFGDNGMFSGTGTFTPAEISELLAGNDFVAVETRNNFGPAAALGGQLIVPEPSLFAIFVCFVGVALIGRRTRRRHDADMSWETGCITTRNFANGIVSGVCNVLPRFESLEQRLQFSATFAFSGAQVINSGSALDLNNPSTSIHEAEILTAVNPTNPLNIVGITGSGSSFLTFFYWTFDGGKTWNKRGLADLVNGHTFDGEVPPPNGGWYDGSVAFDANGALYIAYVGGSTAMRIATSVDGGATLQSHPTIPFISSPDKPLIGVGLDPSRLDAAGKPSVAVYISCTTSAGVQVVGAFGSDVLNWTSGNGPFTAPATLQIP